MRTLTTFVILLLLSNFANARILLSEDFEDQELDFSSFNAFTSGILSTYKPSNGTYHWMPQSKGHIRSNLSSQSRFFFQKGKKYIVSFKAAVEGCFYPEQLQIFLSDKQGLFYSNSTVVAEKINELQTEYKQIIIEFIPLKDEVSYLNFKIDNSEKYCSTSFLVLDEVVLLEDQLALAERPQSTFPIVNCNTYKQDALLNLMMDGQMLRKSHQPTIDGYSCHFEEDLIVIAGSKINLEFTTEDGSGEHDFAVFIDLNKDGDWNDPFETQGRMGGLENDQKYFSLLEFPDTLQSGSYILRFRYLFDSFSIDAVNGNTWGNTMDYLVTVLNTAEIARSESVSKPCEFFDLSGKKIDSSNSVTPGIYIKRCGEVIEKVMLPF